MGGFGRGRDGASLHRAWSALWAQIDGDDSTSARDRGRIRESMCVAVLDWTSILPHRVSESSLIESSCACPPLTRGPVPARRGRSGGLVQRDYARGGSGEGVRGPIAYLSRLLGGVHLLQRRAGVLFEQGPAERPPTLPGMPSGGEAGTDRRRPAGISRRDLRQLRWPGHGPIRAAERPPRLLQLMLRQGPSRNAE